MAVNVLAAASHVAARAAPEVWMLCYDGPPPDRWDANPESGTLAFRVEVPVEGEGGPLDVARLFCRGHNTAERVDPIGLWALLLAPGVGKPGLRVRPVALREVVG